MIYAFRKAWDAVSKLIIAALKELGITINVNNNDLAALIHASYQNLQKGNRDTTEEKLRDNIRAEISKIWDAVKKNGSVIVSAEESDAIQRITDMKTAADDMLEKGGISDTERKRFEIISDEVDKWLDKNVRYSISDTNEQGSNELELADAGVFVCRMTDAPAFINTQELPPPLKQHHHTIYATFVTRVTITPIPSIPTPPCKQPQHRKRHNRITRAWMLCGASHVRLYQI